MSNRAYDILRSIAQIWLPAFGTLMFTFGDIWSLKWAPQATGSIMAVDAFLGAGLGLASSGYRKSGKDIDGEIEVDEATPGKITYTLNVGDSMLGNIEEGKSVKLRIVPADQAPRR